MEQEKEQHFKRKLEKTKFKPAKAKIEVEKSYMVEKETNYSTWLTESYQKGRGMAMQLILFIPFVTKHFQAVNKVHCIPYGYYYELCKVKQQSAFKSFCKES